MGAHRIDCRGVSRTRPSRDGRVGPWAAVLASLALAGCTLPMPRSEPPPQSPPPTLPPLVMVPEVRPAPQPLEAPRRERLEREAPATTQPPSDAAAPARGTESPPARSSAVETLAQASSEAVAAGDLRTAAAQLERALRIAPRDAELWLALAKVRFRQGDAVQAEQMGLRAVQLAPTQPAVQREAWEVIAAARELRGDRAGAAQAREAARLLVRERA